MRLSQREGVDIRPSLLRVLTDLYVQNQLHTRDEEQQFVELAMRLLPNVDASSRAAAAAKLVGYPNAPDVLLTQLAEEIASIKSAQKPEPTSTPRTYQHPQAIEQLSLSPAPFRPGRTELTTSLGERFLRATPAERREILASLSTEFEVDSPKAAPKEILDSLERAALELRPRDFAAELQTVLGLSQRIATQITQDDDGEPVLVAARALGMHIDQLLRVLLFLNPTVGQSVDRIFSLHRLYGEISTAGAAEIVDSWREGGALRHGAHQPLLAPDSVNRASALLSRRAPEAAKAPTQEANGERARR